MNRYYKALSGSLAVAAIFLTSLLTPSCTDVDKSLGSDLVSGDQQMVFGTSTVTGIETYITYDPEAVPMCNMSTMVLGSMTTAEYGKIRSGAAIQFVPKNFQKTDGTKQSDGSDFYEDVDEDAWGSKGYKPVLDDFGLAFRVVESKGDISKPQTFRIYPLSKRLAQSEAYYANTDPAEIADLTKELFSFTLENTVVGAHYADLTATPAGTAFVNELFDYDYETDYSDNSFLDDFYGLYIKPDETVEDGAIYIISFVDGSNTYTYFKLGFHCRNNDAEAVEDAEAAGKPVYMLDGEKVFDEKMLISYSLDDSYTYTTPLTSVIMLEHDYAGTAMDAANLVTPDEDGNVTGDTASEMYVQSLMGVSSYMRFGDEFKAQVDALKNSEGGPYSTINIHNATLLLNLADASIENMNEAPSRLVMYRKYKGVYPFSIAKVATWQSLDDYMEFYDAAPVVVRDYDYLGLKTEYYYGGSLNRNFGRYEMDITETFRDIVNNRATAQDYVWLAPDMLVSAVVSPDKVALVGTPDGSATAEQVELQPRVVVTYTLIK